MNRIGHCNDLTGMRFGKLTVVRLDERRCCGKACWICKCDCGNEKSIIGSSLTQGMTKSCGCMEHVRHHKKKKPLTLTQRRIRNRAKWQKRFSDSSVWQLPTHSDRLYVVWDSMKRRCYNKKANDYYLYGARGIRVCDQWKDYFCEFKAWALLNGYDYNAEPFKCTIDRINVNGDYEPSNCRFVDMKTQMANRRKLPVTPAI